MARQSSPQAWVSIRCGQHSGTHTGNPGHGSHQVRTHAHMSPAAHCTFFARLAQTPAPRMHKHLALGNSLIRTLDTWTGKHMCGSTCVEYETYDVNIFTVCQMRPVPAGTMMVYLMRLRSIHTHTHTHTYTDPSSMHNMHCKGHVGCCTLVLPHYTLLLAQSRGRQSSKALSVCSYHDSERPPWQEQIPSCLHVLHRWPWLHGLRSPQCPGCSRCL